jgi:hypothetical protein
MPEVFPWYTIATIIISVIALVLSGCGLYFSFSAIRLSKKAIDQTKSHFIIENRPYLNGKLITFKENDSYFLFELKEKSFVITVQFKLENKGNIPAKNISVDGPFTIEAAPSYPVNKLILNTPPIITLAPGESKAYLWNMEIGYGDFSQEEVIKQIENKIFEADISMTWKYTSFLDEIKAYESKISYLVKHNAATLLGSEIN